MLKKNNPNMGSGPPSNSDIHHATIVTNTATIHTMTGWVGGLFFEVAGTSKRAPNDPFDEDTAVLLATGRAYRDLGRALVREGYRRNQAMLEYYAALEARQREAQDQYQIERDRRREEWRAKRARELAAAAEAEGPSKPETYEQLQFPGMEDKTEQEQPPSPPRRAVKAAKK